MNSIKQNYNVYVSNPNIIINPNENISYRSVIGIYIYTINKINTTINML